MRWPNIMISARIEQYFGRKVLIWNMFRPKQCACSTQRTQPWRKNLTNIPLKYVMERRAAVPHGWEIWYLVYELLLFFLHYLGILRMSWCNMHVNDVTSSSHLNDSFNAAFRYGIFAMASIDSDSLPMTDSISSYNACCLSGFRAKLYRKNARAFPVWN